MQRCAAACGGMRRIKSNIVRTMLKMQVKMNIVITMLILKIKINIVITMLIAADQK